MKFMSLAQWFWPGWICVAALFLTLDKVHGARSYRLVDILNQVQKEKRKRTEEQKLEQQQQQQKAQAQPSLQDDDVQEGYVEQLLDHFRLADERTFSQRFFYTDRYVRESSTRVYSFLCVGGEGPPLTADVLIDSVHCTGDMIATAKRMYEDTSKDFSIHMYALEHRYYGKSFPNFETDPQMHPMRSSPVTNDHLVYLSSRQAQADLAHFVATQNEKMPDGPIPWITFGGSYPGMMAAYARLRFPHYIAASVSNSAPIQPQLDFEGYNNHVAKVLADTSVGGSPACVATFQEGHAQIAQQIKDPSWHNKIAADFGLCNATQLSEHPRNVELFIGDGVFSLGVQENDPACTEDALCNVGKICAAVLHGRLQGKTSAEALARVARQRQTLDGLECTNIRWQDNLDLLSNVTDHDVEGWRSWLWQTCTEFGFYQTCNIGSNCPFAQGYHPLSQDYEICEKVFGISSTAVARAVSQSREYYGGLDLATTRVLSVNGNVDPWSELALLHSTNDDALPAFVVPGASHHFWTHKIKDDDSLEIVGARELIFTTVVHWLDEIDEEWNSRLESFHSVYY